MARHSGRLGTVMATNRRGWLNLGIPRREYSGTIRQDTRTVMIETAIQQVASGGDLPMETMDAVMGQIMDGACDEQQSPAAGGALTRRERPWPKLRARRRPWAGG